MRVAAVIASAGAGSDAIGALSSIGLRTISEHPSRPSEEWLLAGRRGESSLSLPCAVLRHAQIDAPWVVDGPINGELFRLYVEKVLVPAMKPGPRLAAAG
jgi:hypothetical protein